MCTHTLPQVHLRTATVPMSQIDILLPKMGESVAEATIIKWLKNEGDHVAADEPIVEIATDKVDSEVPAPQDGILLKRLVNDGDVVKVGQLIAHIGTAVESKGTPPAAAPPTAASNGRPTATPQPAAAAASAEPIGKSGPGGKFYSPSGAEHRPERRRLLVGTGVHRWVRPRRTCHQTRHPRLPSAARFQPGSGRRSCSCCGRSGPGRFVRSCNDRCEACCAQAGARPRR